MTIDTNALFLIATKQAFRFQSNQGALSTEQLWHLPLTSRNGFDLDTVAKLAHKQVLALTEESFVKKANPSSEAAEQRLEVVKAVIAVKQADEDAKIKAAEQSAANAEKRKRILAALANREVEVLGKASEDELRRQLAELG